MCWELVWLCLAALAGAVNSITGGGTLLTFPVLLAELSPLGRRHQGGVPDTIPKARSPFRTNWTAIPARTSRSATRQATGPNDARRRD